MTQSVLLVDTNIASYVFKRDTRALPYLRQYLDKSTWVVSFMTLAEMYHWAFRYGWGGAKRARLEAYLAKYTVIPYERQVCLKWAEVVDASRRKGLSISHPDAWIAATALLYRLPLVTHNVKDFSRIDGLEVLSLGNIL